MTRECLFSGCKAPIASHRARALFCSRVCQDKEKGERTRAEGIARRLEKAKAGGYEELACAHCGHLFKRPADRRATGGQTIVCSQACWKARRHERHRQYMGEYRAKERRAMKAPATPPGPADRCQACAHWTAKGCRLEAFRTCKPYAEATHYRAQEARA